MATLLVIAMSAVACSPERPTANEVDVRARLHEVRATKYSPPAVVTVSQVAALPPIWEIQLPFELKHLWRLNDGGWLAYSADWSSGRRSQDPEGRSGSGDGVVLAVSGDGQERWRYDLGPWVLQRVTQSADASIIVFDCSSGESGSIPIVLARNGQEYFRASSAVPLALEAVVDGTGVVRAHGYRDRTRYKFWIDGQASERELGHQLLVDLHANPVSGRLSIDYAAGDRCLASLLVSGSPVVLVWGRSGVEEVIELRSKDGEVLWQTRVHDFLLHSVASLDGWEQAPVAFARNREGTTSELISVDLKNGAILGRMPDPGVGVTVSGSNGVAFTWIEDLAAGSAQKQVVMAHDRFLNPIAWGRTRPSGGTAFDSWSGFVWGSVDNVSEAERSTDILDLSSAQGVTYSSQVDGLWGIHSVVGDTLTLIGQLPGTTTLRTFSLNGVGR